MESQLEPIWLPEFSNCHTPAAPIQIDGVTYRSTEHYYQSKKFHDEDSVRKVCETERPLQAKFLAKKLSRKVQYRTEVQQRHGAIPPKWIALGRVNVTIVPASEWDQRKEEIMLRATLAKYRQHVGLRKLLLGTGDAYLVEQNDKDEYWGWGKDHVSGRNRLGHILMQVRGILREEEAPKHKKENQAE